MENRYDTKKAQQLWDAYSEANQRAEWAYQLAEMKRMGDATSQQIIDAENRADHLAHLADEAYSAYATYVEDM